MPPETSLDQIYAARPPEGPGPTPIPAAPEAPAAGDQAPAAPAPNGQALPEQQAPEAQAPAADPADIPAPAAPEAPEARARADLERRDRELFQRETWLGQKMAELRQFDQIRQLARDNPAEAARQLGLDTLRLAEGLMGNGAQPGQAPEGAAGGGDRVIDYIKRLESKIEDLEGGFQRQTAVGEIKSGLSTSREQYPMLATVAETNPQFFDQLHQLKQQYSKAGRQVDLRDIFDQQEDFYTQSMLQSLTKILTVPKLKEKVAELIQKQAGAPNKQSPPTAPTAQAPKTLRNNMTAEAPTEIPRPKTPEEAAIAARKYKLWAD